MKKLVILGALGVMLSAPLSAERLHTAKTSGILIKDSLELHVFDDPHIKGISCYYTLPKRTLSLEDQTNTSISCRKVGNVSGNVKTAYNIMSRSKSWFFKSLKMDRIYDKKRNALVYMTYTSKLSGDNASNSVSVVVLGD